MEEISKRDKKTPISSFLRERTNLTEFIERKEHESSDNTSSFVKREKNSVSSFIKTKKERTELGKFLRKREPVKEFLKGRKSDVDIVGNVVNSPLSKKDKIRVINLKIMGANPSLETRRKFSEWAWKYMKPILWTTVWSTSLTLCISIAYIYATAGSWGILLGTLQYLGISVIPSAVLKGLKSAGIGIATDMTVSSLISMAKKNKRVRNILETKIPEGYTKKVLEKFGVDTRRLDYESITSQTMANATNFAWYIGTGNMAGFFYSSAVRFGTKTGLSIFKKVKSKKGKISFKPAKEIVERTEKLKQVVANNVLNEPKDKNLVREVNKSINKEVVNLDNSIEIDGKKPKRIVNVPKRVELTESIKEVITNNRKSVYASAIALSTVAIAMSGDATEFGDIIKDQISNYGQDALEKIADLSLSSFNFAKESEIAKTALVGVVLDKVGVNKVIDLFADKLTSTQKREIKTLSEAIRLERKKNIINKISESLFFTLSGGKRYTTNELKNMSRTELKRVYKTLNPRNKRYEKYTSAKFRDLIVAEQDERLKRLNGMFTTAISGTFKAVTSSVVYEASVEGYAYANSSMNELNLAQLELEREMDLAEGLKERKISIEEAESKRISERLERKREAVEKSKAAKFKTEERKARERLEKNIRHEKALERLRSRIETRKLREHALDEKLAREMNIAVVTDQGIAHPLPSEDILLPEKLQEALDWKFTPLSQYAAKEVIKSSTEYVPGVGWIQAAINKVNMGLTVGETLKDIGKVGEVLVRLEMGETGVEIKPTLGGLDEILKTRLPSITTAVDDVIKTDKLVAKDVVLRALKDKVIEGWDNKRTAYEIGKVFLGGTGEDFGIDITSLYGENVWANAF